MSTLRQRVTLADRYVTLSDAAEDFATYQFYHQLALHHLHEAHKHDLDGMRARPVPELRKILEARPH